MLAALPITVPAFVTSYSWVSITPAVQGFGGAAMIVTLAYYPLVYLPVAAVLRGTRPGARGERALARHGSVAHVHARYAAAEPPRPARRRLLVAVHLLSEFGAFAMLRFQTFTTAIYDEYRLSFDGPAASMLATVLVLLCLALLSARSACAAAPATRAWTPARRGPPARARLGRAKWLVAAALAALVGLALGLPLLTLLYWVLHGGRPTFPVVTLLSAAGASLELGLGAAILTTLLALPVSILTIRHPSRRATLLDRAGTSRTPPRHRRRALVDCRLGPPHPGRSTAAGPAARRLRDPVAAARAGRDARRARAGAAGAPGSLRARSAAARCRRSCA